MAYLMAGPTALSNLMVRPKRNDRFDFKSSDNLNYILLVNLCESNLFVKHYIN